MQKQGYRFVWGGLLIVIGLGLLAENLDWLGDWNAPVWSLILGAISLIFLATYAGDRRQWWALIPGLVILAVAVGVFLAEQKIVDGYVVGGIILAGVGLPFLMIFVADRRHWWALIPGMTMSGIAMAVILEGSNVIGEQAVGGIIVGGISVGFLSIYWIDRKQWWALFPGGVMGAIALIIFLAAGVEVVWGVALILLGLAMLRGNLGRGRRASAPSLVEPARPERQRLPTLEEQIEAVVQETDAVQDVEGEEPSIDVPLAPDMPEPPAMPEPPEVK